MRGHSIVLLQVSRIIPQWLYPVIKNSAWDREAKRKVEIYLHNHRTGTDTFVELEHAIEARNLILQVNEVCSSVDGFLGCEEHHQAVTDLMAVVCSAARQQSMSSMLN